MLNYNMKWTLKEAVSVLLVTICLLLAGNIALIVFDFEEFFAVSSRKSLITLGLFLTQEIFFLAPLYFYIMKARGVTLSELGLRFIGAWQTVVWIAKGFGIVIVANFFLLTIMSRLGDLPGFREQISYLPLFGTSKFDLIVAVFVLAIIAPVVEEIVFRGFLLQTLLGYFRPAVASILAAAIFALIHLELQS